MTTLDVPDDPKMLRETLCAAQGVVLHYGEPRFREHSERLQRLIDECDRHRPLGPDGKHGDRHTPTCGCEDKPAVSNEWVPPYRPITSDYPPRRWWHIHRPRLVGHHGPHVIEACHCGAVRVVVVHGYQLVAWTSWHPTARDAIREASALERMGGRPSWRELWHRSGRSR